MILSAMVKGVYVPMPFLRQGYNWYQLLTVDREQYDINTALPVARNHIPCNSIIMRKHVNNRLIFLGWENTTPNYEKVERELELHLEKIVSTITSWLKTFVVYVANEIGMVNGSNRILTWSDYMYWVESSCNSREDAMYVMKSLYIAFHYVQDYKQHITICISYTYNLKIDQPDGEGVSRNFCDKMITFRINQMRLQVNAACKIYNGYKFRIIRPRKKGETNDTTNLDKCVPKYIFKWMITHKNPTNQTTTTITTTSNNKNKIAKHRNMTSYKKKWVETEEDIVAELD